MDGYDRLKRAAVFIPLPGGGGGTGYVIAPRRIGTARHVVRDWIEGEWHPVQAGPLGQRVTLQARLWKLAAAPHDAAVLETDADLPAEPLPVAARVARLLPWEAYGYPQLAGKLEVPPGLPLGGVVRDPDTLSDIGQPALLLAAVEAAAGQASPLHGWSGSPVVVDGALVGHVVKHIGDRDDAQRAAYGLIYACPIAAVVALLDSAPVVAPVAAQPVATRPTPAAAPAGHHHVAIAAHATDAAWVRTLADRLEGAGLSIVVDARAMDSDAAAPPADALLLVCSRGAAGHDWWPRRVQALAAAGGRVAAVRLDDGAGVPAGLRRFGFGEQPRAEGPEVEALVDWLLQRPAPAAASLAARADDAERERTDRFVRRFAESTGDTASILQLLEEWRRTGSTDRSPLLAACEALIARAAWRETLQVLQDEPPSLRVRQLRGLTLRKQGRVEEGIRMFEALRAEGHVDPESAGLLGGSYKARWLKSRDPAFAQRAYQAYLEGWQRSADAFNGINAAAMALHVGEHETSRTIAQQVIERLAAKTGHDAWGLASLAEARLLLGQWDEARRLYGQAAGKAAGQPQTIAVMRRQARLNLVALKQPRDAMDAALPVPRVLAYLGHMTDAPDRAEPRFPAGAVGRVRRLIGEHLDALGPLHGFGTAARGSDVLVLEELAERGLHATVLMPIPEPAFRAVSLGGAWDARFDALRTCETVHFDPPLTDPAPPPDALPAAFARTNREVMQRALELARSIDEPAVVVLAVWDGQPGDGPGGTAEAVQLWQDEDIAPRVIDPRGA